MKAETGTREPLKVSDWYIMRERAVVGGNKYFVVSTVFSTLRSVPGGASVESLGAV